MRDKVFEPISLKLFSPPTAEKYPRHLREFSASLVHVDSLPDYYRLLEKTLKDTVAPRLFYLFLSNSDAQSYLLFSPDHSTFGEISFAESSPLITLLRNKGKPLILDSAETLLQLSQGDQAKLALLELYACFPLQNAKRLVGFVGLGRPLGKMKYTGEDSLFMEEICRLSFLLIRYLLERDEIERQMQQMEALNRLAQGINVTLHFDDLLELIFAQTESILPLTDFWLSAYDPKTHSFSFLFVVEDGERQFSIENIPLELDEYLEKIVLQTAKPLQTNDYTQTARLNGIRPRYRQIQAWMGVPLISGTETLGALSLGHRSMAVIYTPKQLQFLRAIADQTAAAIVKARLLKATQTQARRMTILNEIGRSLTATLELETILDVIQRQGPELISCDEWQALILDETGENFLRPTPQGLQKTELDARLSPFIQEAMHLGTVTFAKLAPLTNETAPKQVLINPLFIEKRPIGLLLLTSHSEVSPFAPEDQELIVTLGHQVSIALANALKYAQTDQALQLRLTELDTLQRIDRELNASLDIERTLNITLSYAFRQSKAEAGTIGLVKKDGFYPVHAVGYAQPLPIPIKQLPFETPISGPLVLEQNLFLEQGQQSAIFPLVREAQTLALLILESSRWNFLTPDLQSFLTRLCSHAAIALSNAILYSEVQQANSAKSEFVSLVSHELKTPMTAIKGYADLIAQGAVGPINELQANFLATIRANVNRMANLVSDLADISRIEAGKLSLQFEATPIHDVLQEVIRTLSTQLEEKKQTLLLHVPNDLPPVWCDRHRLIQIYNNLLSNAIKYSPSQSTIEVNCTLITSREGQSIHQAVLSAIRDHGVGISAEDQPKIFQKFFRSEDPKVRENPGTGLGLSITKHLVEIQGGRIWFESQLGVGTTFYFTIPIASLE
ncbi:MAG: GAF domain-containing protein [Anaerolineales bacterium]|nr:GAF domain-containing protein [Anaerolineales bacterium]MDW8160618.1 GAF domain-containing protein [Anaerolineales bacterium]